MFLEILLNSQENICVRLLLHIYSLTFVLELIDSQMNKLSKNFFQCDITLYPKSFTIESIFESIFLPFPIENLALLPLRKWHFLNASNSIE